MALLKLSNPAQAAAPHPFGPAGNNAGPALQPAPDTATALQTALQNHGDTRITTQTSQQRIADMFRGHDSDGNPIATGGLVPFVEDQLTRQQTRIPKRLEQWDPNTRQWQEYGPNQEAYGRLQALIDSFKNRNHTNTDLWNRMLTYGRCYGQYWIAWTNVATLEFWVLPPHAARTVTASDGREWLQWSVGTEHLQTPAANTMEYLNDFHQPGVPWSPWFPVLDHLDRIDAAFASVSRTLDSRALNTKLVSVNPPGTTTKSAVYTGGGRTPTVSESGDPQKAAGVPMRPALSDPSGTAVDAIQRLGASRVDRGQRRNQKLASAPAFSGVEFDVVDSTLDLDDNITAVIETDLRVVARSTAFPTNFVLSGFGDNNHWSAETQQDEILEKAILPDIDVVDATFSILVRRLATGGLGFAHDADSIRVAAWVEQKSQEEYTVNEILEIVDTLGVDPEWAADKLGIPVEMLVANMADPDRIDRILEAAGGPPSQQSAVPTAPIPNPAAAAAVDDAAPTCDWDTELASLSGVRGW